MAEQAQASAASWGQVPGRREAPEGVAAGGTAGSDHRDAAAALAGAQREDSGPGTRGRGAAALARARSGTGEGKNQCLWEALLHVDRALDVRKMAPVEVLNWGMGRLERLKPDGDPIEISGNRS